MTYEYEIHLFQSGVLKGLEIAAGIAHRETFGWDRKASLPAEIECAFRIRDNICTTMGKHFIQTLKDPKEKR